MKAPIVTPTGCACCGSGGVPGASCATCIRRAHGDALQLVNTCARTAERTHGPRCDLAQLLARERADLVAAYTGAEVLLDALGIFLVRVRFEVPQLSRRSSDAR